MHKVEIAIAARELIEDAIGTDGDTFVDGQVDQVAPDALERIVQCVFQPGARNDLVGHRMEIGELLSQCLIADGKDVRGFEPLNRLKETEDLSALWAEGQCERELFGDGVSVAKSVVWVRGRREASAHQALDVDHTEEPSARPMRRDVGRALVDDQANTTMA
jgi:hypothetical protein